MLDNLALALFHMGLLVLMLRLLRWEDPDDLPRNRRVGPPTQPGRDIS
jgi:hypothetical protein